MIKIPYEYYRKLYELAKIYEVTISHLIRIGIFYITGVYEVPYKPARGLRKYELISIRMVSLSLSPECLNL